ncbi:MAG: hypothetical protein V2A79_10205 [Planctomycetota bacterium]
MTARKPKRYVIRGFDDIYHLPTDEMVERCLKELATIMIVTRESLELLRTAAHPGKLPPPKMTITWPSEFIWRDDRSGTSKVDLGLGGKPLVQINVTHKTKEDEPSEEL